MTDISRRKDDHLDLATKGEVGFRSKTTLLECVTLMHDSLVDFGWDDLDTRATLFGKELAAPILIAAMTGGTERATRVNRELAAIAEEHGYAFGLGSQRAMQRDATKARSYQVRDVAPSAVLLGNVGVVQARQCSNAELEDLVGQVGADALCVHLNPAMELIQSDGDRDFSGALDTLGRLASELSVPVVAKETGCGLSFAVARRLQGAGIEHVDVSGAGGTSWVGVETLRAEDDRRGLGQTFWEWGIPTAASVSYVARFGFRTVFATGGIKNGLDVAKCIALGASAGGIARGVLVALEEGGSQGAVGFLKRIETELKTAMLLSGARSLGALSTVPRVVQGPLQDWMNLS
jgi:isopentenyl-diphosphate delta-isomerase